MMYICEILEKGIVKKGEREMPVTKGLPSGDCSMSKFDRNAEADETKCFDGSADGIETILLAPLDPTKRYYVRGPRLANRQDAEYFIKTITEHCDEDKATTDARIS